MSSPRADDAEPPGMTIVAWSGDLDRIWPTLILGSAGAASGMRTTIFFTFWGLFPLVRDEVRLTGTDAMTRALASLNRPGLGRARLSKLELGGVGSRIMRRLARQKKIADPAELLEMCLQLGVELWPCEMTMDLMGVRHDQLVKGVGAPVGAATAVAEMSRSQVNLFI